MLLGDRLCDPSRPRLTLQMCFESPHPVQAPRMTTRTWSEPRTVGSSLPCLKLQHLQTQLL